MRDELRALRVLRVYLNGTGTKPRASPYARDYWLDDSGLQRPSGHS